MSEHVRLYKQFENTHTQKKETLWFWHAESVFALMHTVVRRVGPSPSPSSRLAQFIQRLSLVIRLSTLRQQQQQQQQLVCLSILERQCKTSSCFVLFLLCKKCLHIEDRKRLFLQQKWLKRFLSKNTYKPDRIGMKQKATTEKQNSHKPVRKDPFQTDHLIQVKMLKKKTKHKTTTSQWD